MKNLLAYLGILAALLAASALHAVIEANIRPDVVVEVERLMDRTGQLEIAVDDSQTEMEDLGYEIEELFATAAGLEERLDEIDTAIEELNDTTLHEIDNREMYGEWTEGELQELRDSIDELKEEITRLKTG